MNAGTLAAMRALVQSDPSIPAAEAGRILQALAGPAPAEDVPRILRPRDAARRLGVHVRTIRNLARGGTLHPVRLPGRVRALGYREADILAVIGGAR